MPDRESTTVMINYYKCACCKKWIPEKTFYFKEKIVKSEILWEFKSFDIKLKNNVEIDHIDPVVTIWYEVNWHNIILKLLDENVDNYQLLCKDCHKTITNKENKER